MLLRCRYPYDSTTLHVVSDSDGHLRCLCGALSDMFIIGGAGTKCKTCEDLAEAEYAAEVVEAARREAAIERVMAL